MTTLKEKLTERDYLPVLKMADGREVTRENWRERREEMLALLEKYSYGHTPKCPVKVWGETLEINEKMCAGKVRDEKVMLSFETEHGVTSYTVELFIPKNIKKPPVFLHLAFRPVPDRYIPVEEITDAGYALAVVVYTDMVNDAHFGDFSDGIARHFGTTKDRSPEEWGKIGMWAYGASRVLDYMIEYRSDIDTSRVAVIGHSRLGKTALWCGAQDERFAAVISNDSGYGGAGSSKGGCGEFITDFIEAGSDDWFCENFKTFIDSEDSKPYDQSFLLALVAPRLLCVGSALKDVFADYRAEFLTTLHASSAWELLGERGLICPDRMPIPGDLFTDGNVGYHLRDNLHYLSREDWNAYIKFLNVKFK